MEKQLPKNSFFESEGIWRILFRVAPPIMIAQLIQALYNIVDSYFIGAYADEGLTALSVMFPVQLMITAIAVGTGAGMNTEMARLYALRESNEADETAGTGLVLAVLSWALTALLALAFMRAYVSASVNSPLALEYGVTYGLIVCVGSLGIFLESSWTKVHQAQGDMRTPMIAQIAGAVTNIILDPIFIFGLGPVPELGIAGAALATVTGQFAAAAITGFRGFRKPPARSKLRHYAKPVYVLGAPSIIMQMLYVIYIAALNLILSGFSDNAVTVLGLYYKVQAIFVVPLMGMQPSIIPVLSYNFTRRRYDRCKKIMVDSCLFAAGFLLIGVFCYEVFPGEMIGLFTDNAEVLSMGIVAFRITGLSFLPSVLSFLVPTFFQSIGRPKPSIFLAVFRPMGCLVPLFWALSFISLDCAWLAFPLAELITGSIGLFLSLKLVRSWDALEKQENIKCAP